MSSLLRSYLPARSLPNPAGFVPAYFTNSDGYDQPFPWRYDRKTQALDLDFVDGFTNSTVLSSNDLFFRGQQLGGLRLVQKLGPKFIEWCETVSDVLADAGTVELYEKPVIVTANAVAPNQSPNNGETQEETYPISFENASGTEAGKYCKTVVFMKPMVITYLRSGTRYYRWFNQNFEGNT